jgi:transcriptional antiterminator NusG
MSSVDVDSGKGWYVIHVRSGYEQEVIENLRELIQKQKLEDQFGEILTPTEKVLEMRNGRQRKVPRKFFSGYVMINMAMNDSTLQLVRHVKNKNIRGFLGSGDRPVPLSQREVDGIFERLSATEGQVKPKMLFRPGQVVKIIAGPFEGLSGVIEEADYEKKNRLRISVVFFQRAISVDLEFSEVKAA